eukprot:SAG22_NODE_261_length_13373_cov_17.745472_4_plen_310_part_00
MQQDQNGKIKGTDVIRLVNTQLSVMKTRQGAGPPGQGSQEFTYRVRAVEEAVMETLLDPFVPTLRRLYSADSQAITPAQWLYMANMQMAYSNFHEKFRQVGTEPDAYERWVDGEALQAGLARLRAVVPPSVQITADDVAVATAAGAAATAQPFDVGQPKHIFEHDMLVEFEAKLVTPGKAASIVGVCGTVDWAAKFKTEPPSGMLLQPDMIEIKFVSELGANHRLQALVYAALHAVHSSDSKSASSTCLLFNARTGEQERVEIDAARATVFLVALAKFKHSGQMPGDAGLPGPAAATTAAAPVDFDDDL